MVEIDLLALVTSHATAAAVPMIIMLWRLRWEEVYKRDYLEASKIWERKAERMDSLVASLYQLEDVALFRGAVVRIDAAEEATNPFGKILAHSLDLVHNFPELCQAYGLPNLMRKVQDLPIERVEERTKALDGLKNVAMVVSQRVLIQQCEEVQRFRARLAMYTDDDQVVSMPHDLMMSCFRMFHGRKPEAEMSSEVFGKKIGKEMGKLQGLFRKDLRKTLEIRV